MKRKTFDDPDMEAMLPQEELEDMGKNHYKRYRMVWPPGTMPSDQVVSRNTQEITKQMLGVTSVFRAKTQAMQLKAVRKRTKVGNLGFLHGGFGEDDEPKHDIVHYLNCLLVLLICSFYS